MQVLIDVKAEEANSGQNDRYICVLSAQKWQRRAGYFDIIE